jgi:hypothetical protein
MFDNNKNESDNQKRKHLERFAKSTKGKISGIHDKLQQKNQERVAKNEADFKEINIRINNIVNSDEPNNMKIQKFQRLLNEKSKKMDKPMMQTIKNELTKLHEIEGTSENNDNNLPDTNDNNLPDTNDNNLPDTNDNNLPDNVYDDDEPSDIKSPSEVFAQGL